MEAQRRPGPARPGEPVGPEVRALSPLARTPPATSRMARAQAVLSDPAKVAAGFWVVAAAALLSVVFTGHWTHDTLVHLMPLAGLCLIVSGVNFFAGERMPHWAFHIGAVAATAMVTVGPAVGSSDDVDWAVLYIWIVIYAALFFSPMATLAYVAAIGAAYAVLLGVGPAVVNPVATWLAICGTGAVAGAAVLGLVSVLRSDAREDPLTGLANRRSWDERLEEEMERARRAGTALSLAMIDLDDFKAINDNHGHKAGDLLLRELSAAWQGVVRGSGDFLARLGGDEFGLLAPGSEATGARRLAKRLDEVAPEGVAYSIGVTTWDGKETAGDLLHRADQAMYRVKLEHRGSR